jgi:hypothetical protein
MAAGEIDMARDYSKTGLRDDGFRSRADINGQLPLPAHEDTSSRFTMGAPDHLARPQLLVIVEPSHAGEAPPPATKKEEAGPHRHMPPHWKPAISSKKRETGLQKFHRERERQRLAAGGVVAKQWRHADRAWHAAGRPDLSGR